MVSIIILCVAVVIICSLLVFFYFSFKRDSKKNFMKSVGGSEAAKFIELKSFLKECLLEKNKDKTLFVLRINKLAEIKKNMTEVQFEYLMEQIILRCKQVFAKDVLLFRNENDDIYMLSKKSLFQEDSKELCELLILETTRPIILADALKKTISVSVCNLELYNVIDIEVVSQQINTVLTRLEKEKVNAYEFIDAEINTNSIQYFELYKAFESALEHKSIQMQYYPVVNLYTKEIASFEGKSFFKIKDEYCSAEKLDKFIEQSEQIASQVLKMTYKEILKQEKKWTVDFANNEFTMSTAICKAQLENAFLFDDLRQVSRVYSLENKRQIFEVVYDQDISKQLERKLELLFRMGYKIHIKDFNITERAMSFLEKDYVSGVSVSVEDLKNTDQEQERKFLIDSVIKYCEKNGKMMVVTDVNDKDSFNIAIAFGVKYIQGEYVCKCDKPNNFKSLKCNNKITEV